MDKEDIVVIRTYECEVCLKFDIIKLRRDEHKEEDEFAGLYFRWLDHRDHYRGVFYELETDEYQKHDDVYFIPRDVDPVSANTMRKKIAQYYEKYKRT